MIDQAPRIFARERLEIGEERARAGDIGLRLLVEAAMNRLVRPLEQHGFAVGHQFDAGVAIFRVEMREGRARQHHRRRDIVLHLHLVGRMEIRAQLVNAPGAVGIVAHAQVIAHQPLAVELQLVAQVAVDAVHGEVLPPVVAPFGPVVALDGEHKLADGLRQVPHPLVVLVGVIGGGGQQLDHRAE